MTHNYIALYVHLIWTTKYREPILRKEVRYRLFGHIRTEAALKSINIRIINGVDDHVHCLLALTTTQTVSTVVQFIKGKSSRWLNENKMIEGVFTWQEGYGAIPVSPAQVPVVRDTFSIRSSITAAGRWMKRCRNLRCMRASQSFPFPKTGV